MKLFPRLAKTLIGLLAACLLVVVMFRWFEHSQVYHPNRVLTATGAELGRPFEDVRFKAGDGVELLARPGRDRPAELGARHRVYG